MWIITGFWISSTASSVLLWVAVCLGLLVGIFGFASGVITHLRNKPEKTKSGLSFEPLKEPRNAPLKRNSTIASQGIKTAGFVALLWLAHLSGMWRRDAQLANHQVTYLEVYIAEKSSDTSFKIQPARMAPIPTDVCHSVVDWKQGETLTYLTYEQMKGCKRVIAYDRHSPERMTDARLSLR